MSDAYYAAYDNQYRIGERSRLNELSRQAGGMMARGDLSGARNALYTGGQLEAGQGVQQGIDANAKREAEALDRFTTGLSRVLDMPEYASNPEAAWQASAPFAQRLGLDPTELENQKGVFLRNPKAWASFMNQKAKEELQIVEGPNGIYAVNKATGKSQKVQDYPEAPIALDPEKNYYMRDGASTAPQGARSAGGFDAVINPLLQREGGFVAKDGRSGAPANFGINQRYNPDIDVRNLTPEKAKEIYRSRYWDVIGGDQLPSEAQAAVFDAAVNQGPQRALQWWQQSGGDLSRFNQLRLQHYRSRPDYAQNGKSWEARVAETGGGGLRGGAGQDAVGALPGYRQVQAAQVKPKEQWVDLPGGGQQNAVTGEKKNVGGADKITDGARQGASLAFASLAGNERMNELARRGMYKPSSPIESLIKPDSNGFIRLVARKPEDRQFIQAATEFLAPILRKDTGAAVTYQEFMFYKDMLIPAFEDDKQLLWQKAKARDAQIRRIYGASRRAYDQEYGAPGRWSVLTDPAAKPGAAQAPKAAPKAGPKTQGQGWKVLSVE